MHNSKRIRGSAVPSVLFTCALVLSGCVLVREATIPIPAIYHDATSSDACTLLVYLPGNGDSPDAFAYNGLIISLRSQGLDATVVGVDAHLGYYSNNSLVARLKEDVIEPAKNRGFRNIWLVGNSLGGVGSLMYVKEYPNDIAGVVHQNVDVGIVAREPVQHQAIRFRRLFLLNPVSALERVHFDVRHELFESVRCLNDVVAAVDHQRGARNVLRNRCKRVPVAREVTVPIDGAGETAAAEGARRAETKLADDLGARHGGSRRAPERYDF